MKSKKTVRLIGILILLAAGSAAAMSDLYVSGTWRYKMTVVVETPEGIKTGSAVREVSNSTSSVKLDLPQATNPAEVKGEAVVVDLDERGKLFALLKGYKWGENHADSILYDLFPSGHGGTTADGIRFYDSLKNAKVVLEPTDYPLLVTFKNLNDPKTITPVLEMKTDGKYPLKYTIQEDHFEELFGKGVKLKEITIETTEEPVTRMIDQHLPSFGNETGFMEWFKKLRYGDIRRIGPYNFKKGG